MQAGPGYLGGLRPGFFFNAPVQPAAAEASATPLPEDGHSAPSGPMQPSLQAQQLEHSIQKATPTFSTNVPHLLYQGLEKFITHAEVPPSFKAYCLTSLKEMQKLYQNQTLIPRNPNIYLQCIESLSLFFQQVCQSSSSRHQLKLMNVDLTRRVPVISGEDFAPVYQKDIHPAFKIFQRYVNLFFADLKKRGWLADHIVKASDPSKPFRLHFSIDNNGYVPITHKHEGDLSAVYVRYGEDVVEKPANCNQKVLIFHREEFEPRPGILVELNKEPILPILPMKETISIKYRYGIHDPSPFFCYDLSMVTELKNPHASINLIKLMFAKEIAEWSQQQENRVLYLPLPDFNVEGPEFTYLYLEELVRTAENAEGIERADAQELIKQIEAAEEKPVQGIMEDLKDEIIQTLEVEEPLPPAALAAPKLTKTAKKNKKHHKPPAVEEEKKTISASEAAEEERKANKARRLQEKFEEVIGKKRVKLRQATKLFNAVFKNNPGLKITRESTRGSHVSVATSEGAATAVRPHGGKDISVNKRPLISFIDKITKATPAFFGKKS